MPVVRNAPSSFSLHPLAAALALALPSLALHAAGPVVVTPPPVNAVPLPNATWRTYGNGAAGPVNVKNTRGGVDQTVSQTSQQAIYSWKSFDVGANSSVTFDMAGTGYSALNRVTGGGPSRIFGGLHATKGGEIYVINQNGILFGGTAVVDTGSLIASGLDITDDVYKSSLLSAITGNTPAFSYTGTPADFVDAKNFVQVDPGATITTASGGRVFLFAKRVENDGAITSPDGQVALAAGSQVWLQLPTNRLEIYASESNPSVPALRGLLVEVGDAFGDQGPGSDIHASTVTNGSTGTIATPRGNATLVGMAVNQLGRVSATTSVSENGSIFLRAQGQSTLEYVVNVAEVSPKANGALVLGAGSVTEVLPDTQAGSDGKAPTTNDDAGFTTSRIDLVGHTVSLESNASVHAPGGIVNARAEAVTPSPYTLVVPTIDPSARLVLADGARIDVAGTTDATASVDRWFVTTDLLTSSDLKDAPLQKDGLLYRSQATIDVRRDSLILGDLSRYRSALQRTVDERLSHGGTVNLTAQGAVLAAAGSSIDVSGGQVTYGDALVHETKLLSQQGQLYTLNTAPSDLVYTLGIDLKKASLVQYDRWGALGDALAGTPGRLEPGYVDGQAAGSVSVLSPSVVLQGAFSAHTVQGERQRTGLDPVAAGGRLSLGNAASFKGFDGFDDLGALPLLGNFAITASGPAVAGLWADPLLADLPEVSGATTSTLLGAGFGSIAVQAKGDVSLDAGAVTLADGTSLALRSSRGDVSFGGAMKDRGGRVELTAETGRVDVADGARVDLAGGWLNELADGPLARTGLAGGTFTAQGGAGVRLGTGSLVDVSGGIDIGATGAISGGDAGAIKLLAGRTDGLVAATILVPPEARTLSLDGTLRGQALQSAQGGSLALRSAAVQVGDTPGGHETTADLVLSAGFFGQGGFSRYAVDGLISDTLLAGTVVQPARTSWWSTTVADRLAPTGTSPDARLASGQAPGTLAPRVDLTLAASGLADPTQPSSTVSGGALTLAAGSRIELQPGAAFAASAMQRLEMDGTLVDHGGNASFTLAGGATDAADVLWLGRGSLVDVSGTTVVTPSTDGLVRGTVQAGGTVTLTAGAAGGDHLGTTLVLQQGARIDLDGTSGRVDVTQQGSGGGVTTTRQLVASAGGSLAVSGTSDLLLEGSVSARSGGATAAGGSISITQTGPREQIEHLALNPTAVLPILTLQQAATMDTASLSIDAQPTAREIAARTLAGGPGASRAAVSADWLAASGASDLALNAPGGLAISGDVTLGASRSLTVDAPAISLSTGGDARLSAATLTWSNVRPFDEPNGAQASAPPVPTASGGTGTLTFSGTNTVLDGVLATQGARTVTVGAAQDLQLRSTRDKDASAGHGRLDVGGDVRIAAGQVYPATAQAFTIAATGHDVTFSGGDATRATPASAGGSLAVQADTITQGGVVRAPFGSLAFDAARSLTLASGSITSVSGAGLTVLGGTTSEGGTQWLPPQQYGTPSPVTALPAKRLALDAPSVTTAAGATVDLSGGGSVLADEFIPGSGGSRNVFSGADGSFAIVPGAPGVAAFDPANASGTAAPQGRQLVIGPGGPIPAGTYTLLPARDALLPGAYLVTPVAGTSLSYGAAIARPDGSVVVGARLADAGTPFVSSLSSSWRLQTREQALRSSEVRLTDADTFFAAAAAHAGTVAPRGASDGGVLQVAAANADVAGTFRFDGAADAGRGGVAAFSATHIVVADDGAAHPDGVLTLSAGQLGAMAPDTLLLGATVGGATAAGTALDVVAQDVRFSATSRLAVKDLVAAASGSLTVDPRANIVATAAAGTTSPFTLAGDGAALRVSGASGATLTRTGAVRDAGTLAVGAGAHLDAGAGTLVLDSTTTTTVAPNATLHAADLTLAAGRVLVGAGADPTALVLSPALLAQVDDAASLTLRGYERISFTDATTLGGDAQKRLTLDTTRLQAFAGDATVSAGEIHLANSTGQVQADAVAGTGTLTLHADSAHGSGQVVLDDGSVAVNGAQRVDVRADGGLVLAGAGGLVVGGDLVVTTPQVTASSGAGVPVTGPSATTTWTPTAVPEATLSATGALTLARTGATPAATASTPGAKLSLAGASIEQDTRITLPSGEVDLDAATGNVLFGAGSRTSVAGSTITIDGTTVGTAGGRVQAASANGGVTVAGAATVDVSAAGTGDGGAAAFTATHGAVTLAGTVLGTASDASHGATLAIDAGHGPTLDRLADLQAASGGGQFSGGIDLRQRQPGTPLTLDAGHTLRAADLSIDADRAGLVIAGTLDASGAEGGRVSLAASGDVVVASGGRIDVHATGGAAGVPAPSGRIELTTSDGRLTLADGATLDLRNAAAPTDPTAGGRLTLRAPRLGITALETGGTDVAIDAIGAKVVGASGVDVQAVQTYTGVKVVTNDPWDLTPGTLSTATIDTDAGNFLGPWTGARADAIATRLANGDAGLLDALRIHAEADVRAVGGLLVTGTTAAGGGTDEWSLPTWSAIGYGWGSHVGDTSVTLRATGAINVQRSISSGFGPAWDGWDPREVLTMDDHAGTIRLVAGADLAAADAMRTRSTGAYDLSVGRDDQHGVYGVDWTNLVTLRSTTGDVKLAASGDVDLSVHRALVYTTGRDSTDLQDAAVRQAIGATADGTFAFRSGGGDVSISARGDVLGRDAARDQYDLMTVSEELSVFRMNHGFSSGTVLLGDPAAPTIANVEAWASAAMDPSQVFGPQQGLASFGGGRIDVSAGGDVRNLVAVAPSTGYVLRGQAAVTGADGFPTLVPDGTWSVRRFDGGDVRVHAGRDVVNGVVESGGAVQRVQAGRDVSSVGSPLDASPQIGLRVITENGASDVAARRSIDLDAVTSAFWMADQALTGLDGAGRADVQAAGGDLQMRLALAVTSTGYDRIVVPARLSLTAPAGDIRLGDAGERGAQPDNLNQVPVFDSALDMLAGRDLTVVSRPRFGVTQITAAATLDLSDGPLYFPSISGMNETFPTSLSDDSDRSAVHLAAGRDLTLATVDSARPVRLAAGRDLELDGVLTVRHEPTVLDPSTGQRVPASELSSLTAGRDLSLVKQGTHVDVAGTGDLVVVAGRDIELGIGTPGPVPAGLVATGNTRDDSTKLLPAQSANITVIAGLRASGGDVSQAVAQGFEAVGANALTSHAGDLYAQLGATSGVVALGTDAAKAFDAQPVDAQLAQVRTLMGGAAYDAALATYVRTLPGHAGQSDAAARAAFGTLTDAQRDAAPGVLLAGRFAQADAGVRHAFVAEVAAASPSTTYGQALVAYVQGVAGSNGAPLDVAGALAAFEAMPLERQMPFIDTVLVSEVRASGRAAAAASGEAQQAAYARGYRSIAAVFPTDSTGTDGSTTRPAGDLRMPEATIKTLQGGDVTLFAPGGGVDAGGLGASALPANNLGLVTVAGGDISAVVSGDFQVNQSRVFTLKQGDVLVWSSEGSIDAGRGAKTVVGAPAPVLRIDGTGHLYLDTSGSFTGSGIAVLDARSTLDLYAPAGAIDAGEAGIRSAGNAFFAAQTFIGTDNLQVGGQSTGAPPPTSAVGATAHLATASPDTAAQAGALADEERQERRQRRSKRQVLLEFLGFTAGG